MDVPLIFSIICWNSLTSMDMPVAISSSEAARPRDDSRRRTVSSTSRAFWRTERGTQSMVRSSSKMAPRIRVTAYVLNLTCFPGSNLSMASNSPKTPKPTRSSNSTFCGMPMAIFPATYFTSGAYWRTKKSRSF